MFKRGRQEVLLFKLYFHPKSLRVRNLAQSDDLETQPKETTIKLDFLDSDLRATAAVGGERDSARGC